MMPNKNPKPRSKDFKYVFFVKDENSGINKTNIVKLIVKSKTNEVINEMSQDFLKKSPITGVDFRSGSKFGAKLKARIAAKIQLAMDNTSLKNPRK